MDALVLICSVWLSTASWHCSEPMTLGRASALVLGVNESMPFDGEHAPLTLMTIPLDRAPPRHKLIDNSLGVPSIDVNRGACRFSEDGRPQFGKQCEPF